MAPTGPDPLHEALSGLVGEGTLSPAQAQRVDEALRAAGVGRATVLPVGPERRERVVEVLSYLGGALVLGALLLIVGLAWDDLGRPARLAICGGATVLLLAAAAAVRRLGPVTDGRRRTLASALAALSSVGAAITTGVAVEPDEMAGLIYVGVAMTVVSVGGYLVWRGAPLVWAMFGGGLEILLGVLDLVPASWEGGGLYGTAFVAYGAGWIGLGRVVRERHVAGVLGGLAGLVGAEVAAVDDPSAWLGLVLATGVVAAMFALFWTTQRWWYAVLGAGTALVVPTTALGVIWDDPLIAGVVLLVVGVILIVGAVATVRRRRTPT